MRTAAATGLAIVVSGIVATAHADFGDPLSGLTKDEQARFAAGKAQFVSVEDVADGLGPVFNGNACGACHVGPGGAVGGSDQTLETRFGAQHGAAAFDPLAQFGGSLRQANGIGTGDGSASLPALAQCKHVSFAAELVPSSANIVADRRTTPLFGLGLVDATPDATFIKLASDEAKANRDTAGVVSLVDNPDTGARGVVGRFGWKAQNATLHVFAGDAYVNEMGITNPSFPDENCPGGDCSLLACNPVPALNDDGGDVTAFADFMTFLAPPPAGKTTKAGAQLFADLGCADCHTPMLTTGANASRALANKDYHPYSDFLLHDMGALGDGIAQNQATGRLMRTAPLWGVHTQTHLLHDGRATSIAEAIVAHDGQAAAAATAFRNLSQTQRQVLIDFVNAL